MGKEKPESPESEKIEKLPPAKEAGPELAKKVGPGEAKEAQSWANEEVRNLVEKSQQTFEELKSTAAKEGVDPKETSQLEEKFKGIHQEMQNLLKQYEADLAKYAAPTKELAEVEALLGMELGEATKAGETEKEALKSKVEEAKKGVEVVGKKLEELAKAREETELKEREAKRIDTTVDALDKSGVKMASVIENLDPAVAGEAIGQAIESIKTGKGLSKEEKNRALEVQKNQDKMREELNKNKETQIKDIESRFQIPADLQSEKEKFASARSKLEGMTEGQKIALGKDKYDLALSVLATKEGDLQKRIDEARQDFVNQEKSKIDEEFKTKEEELKQDFNISLRKLALEAKGGDVLKQLMKEGKVDDDKLAEVVAKQIEDKPDNFKEEAYRFFPKDALEKVLKKISDNKILKMYEFSGSLILKDEFLNRWQEAFDKRTEEFKRKVKELRSKMKELEGSKKEEAQREQEKLYFRLLGSPSKEEEEEGMANIIYGATDMGEREVSNGLEDLIRDDKLGWDEMRKKIFKEAKRGGGYKRENKKRQLDELIGEMKKMEKPIEEIATENEALLSEGEKKIEEISKEAEQILTNPDFQKEKLESYNLENPKDYEKIKNARESLFELHKRIGDVRYFLTSDIPDKFRWYQRRLENDKIVEKIWEVKDNYYTKFAERWAGTLGGKVGKREFYEKLAVLEKLKDRVESQSTKISRLQELINDTIRPFERNKEERARKESEGKVREEWEKKRDKKAETFVGDVGGYKQYRHEVFSNVLKMDEGIFELNKNLIKYLGEKRRSLEDTIKELEHFNEIKDQYSLFKREIEGVSKKECERKIDKLLEEKSDLEAGIKKSEDKIKESLSGLQDRGEKAKKQLVAGEFKKWLGAEAEEGIYKDAPKIISQAEREQHFSTVFDTIKNKIESDVDSKIQEATKAVESVLSRG